VPLVVDTGPVVAFMDRRDPRHDEAFELITTTPEDVVIPGPNLVEIDYWLRKRTSAQHWRALIDDIAAGSCHVNHLELADLLRAAELEALYEDLGLGIVDASVIAICERLGETELATFDRRHFALVRPRHCDAFTLLPG
jgi:hypothetical protein